MLRAFQQRFGFNPVDRVPAGNEQDQPNVQPAVQNETLVQTMSRVASASVYKLGEVVARPETWKSLGIGLILAGGSWSGANLGNRSFAIQLKRLPDQLGGDHVKLQTLVDQITAAVQEVNGQAEVLLKAANQYHFNLGAVHGVTLDESNSYPIYPPNFFKPYTTPDGLINGIKPNNVRYIKLPRIIRQIVEVFRLTTALQTFSELLSKNEQITDISQLERLNNTISCTLEELGLLPSALEINDDLTVNADGDVHNSANNAQPSTANLPNYSGIDEVEKSITPSDFYRFLGYGDVNSGLANTSAHDNEVLASLELTKEYNFKFANGTRNPNYSVALEDVIKINPEVLRSMNAAELAAIIPVLYHEASLVDINHQSAPWLKFDNLLALFWNSINELRIASSDPAYFAGGAKNVDGEKNIYKPLPPPPAPVSFTKLQALLQELKSFAPPTLQDRMISRTEKHMVGGGVVAGLGLLSLVLSVLINQTCLRRARQALPNTAANAAGAVYGVPVEYWAHLVVPHDPRINPVQGFRHIQEVEIPQAGVVPFVG